MNERTTFDRIRDDARGDLAPLERELLARELAADPKLAELAAEFRIVYALTAQDTVAAERSSLEFGELMRNAARDETPRAWPRKVAAAVLIVGLAGAAILVWRSSRAPISAPLVLQSIDLHAADSDVELEALPREWATYDPRDEKSVRWLMDVGEAARLASAVERPMLVFGFFPTCPMCSALDKNVFSDSMVVGLADRFVPIRIDLSELPEAEAQAMIARGYPFLETWCPDDDEKFSLARVYDPHEFEKSMQDGLATCETSTKSPEWPEFRALVRMFEDARSRLESGEPASADQGFRALAKRAHGTTFFTELATSGLRRIAHDVCQRFLSAQERAASDPAGARRILHEALALYSGTPFEPDLSAALDRLERDGRFPAVAMADHAAH